MPALNNKKVSDVNPDPKELAMGRKVEKKEHTDGTGKSSKIGTGISLDHLAEIPDYYSRLKAMEDKAKSEGKYNYGNSKEKGPKMNKQSSFKQGLIDGLGKEAALISGAIDRANQAAPAMASVAIPKNSYKRDRMRKTVARVTRIPAKGQPIKPLSRQQSMTLADPMKRALKKVHQTSSMKFGPTSISPVFPKNRGQGMGGMKKMVADNIENSRKATIEAKRSKRKANSTRQKNFFSSGFDKKSSFEDGFVDKIAKESPQTDIAHIKKRLADKSVSINAAKSMNNRLIGHRVREGLIRGNASMAKNMARGTANPNYQNVLKGISKETGKDMKRHRSQVNESSVNKPVNRGTYGPSHRGGKVIGRPNTGNLGQPTDSKPKVKHVGFPLVRKGNVYEQKRRPTTFTGPGGYKNVKQNKPFTFPAFSGKPSSKPVPSTSVSTSPKPVSAPKKSFTFPSFSGSKLKKQSSFEMGLEDKLAEMNTKEKDDKTDCTGKRWFYDRGSKKAKATNAKRLAKSREKRRLEKKSSFDQGFIDKMADFGSDLGSWAQNTASKATGTSSINKAYSGAVSQAPKRPAAKPATPARTSLIQKANKARVSRNMPTQKRIMSNVSSAGKGVSGFNPGSWGVKPTAQLGSRFTQSKITRR